MEDRTVPAGATYGGGSLLRNVEVSAVFDGPDWSTDADLKARANQLTTFLNQIVDSPYMDQLGEYSGGDQTIGRGSFSKIDLSPDGWKTQEQTIDGKTYGMITDSDIREMLKQEISHGRLPQPDANSLYVVFVNPNTVVSGPSGFPLGYHETVPDDNGNPLYSYAVVVDPSAYHGKIPWGITRGSDYLQADTYVTSHELAEAVTDPDTNYGWRAEIGDIAQDAMPLVTDVRDTLDGFTVQKLWSNVLGTSLVPPPDTVKYVITDTAKYDGTGSPGSYAMALTGSGKVMMFGYQGTGWTDLSTGFRGTDLMACGGSVYEVGTDGNAPVQIRHWNGTGWNDIISTRAQVAQVVAAGDQLYILGDTGGSRIPSRSNTAANQVWRYSDTGWQPVSERGVSQIAVGADPAGAAQLFKLSGGQVSRLADPAGSSKWVALPALPSGFTTVQSIATTADGSLYALAKNSSGQVHVLRRDLLTPWEDVTDTSTSVTQIVAAGNQLYMLADNGGGKQVWKYSGSGTDWGLPITATTTVTQIVAAGDGLYMLGDTGGGNRVSKYNGHDTSWADVSPPTSAGGTIYSIAAVGQQLQASILKGGLSSTYQYTYTYSGSNPIWNVIS